MLLVLDNFDSFTHNLLDYLDRVGAAYRLFRNDVPAAEVLAAGPYTGLLISPGPARPADAGCLNEVLRVLVDKVPVLGICLGHQAIGEFFGASLVRASVPVHGKQHEIHRQSHPIFSGLPQSFHVVRYHSLVLDPVHLPLRVLAQTSEGTVMAVAHECLPVVGLQFHPEAWLTEYGYEIIANWYELVVLPSIEEDHLKLAALTMP